MVAPGCGPYRLTSASYIVWVLPLNVLHRFGFGFDSSVFSVFSLGFKFYLRFGLGPGPEGFPALEYTMEIGWEGLLLPTSPYSKVVLAGTP